MALKKGDPMKTRTGKELLGPLSVAQLTKLLETTGSKKRKAQIRRALAARTLTQQVKSPESIERRRLRAERIADAKAHAEAEAAAILAAAEQQAAEPVVVDEEVTVGIVQEAAVDTSAEAAA